jgi:hypothetical protein
MRYWKVYYEWSWHEYEADVYFGDELNILFRNESWGVIKHKIKRGIGDIELKRWKVEVDEDGDETGEIDFDYAYVEKGELAKETDWNGCRVPRKFHKEFNDWKEEDK